MQQRHDFCRYFPHPPGWTLLVMADDGCTVLQRLPLTEWLYWRALHPRLDVYLCSITPVTDHQAHSGGHYLVESPSGERISLEAARRALPPAWEAKWLI